MRELRQNMTWPDLTRPDLTWPDLTWPDLTRLDLTWPYFTWPELILIKETLLELRKHQRRQWRRRGGRQVRRRGQARPGGRGQQAHEHCKPPLRRRQCGQVGPETGATHGDGGHWRVVDQEAGLGIGPPPHLHGDMDELYDMRKTDCGQIYLECKKLLLELHLE